MMIRVVSNDATRRKSSNRDIPAAIADRGAVNSSPRFAESCHNKLRLPGKSLISTYE